MPEPPRTEEGWYALHDFRTVDWDAWRATAGERDRAVEEGVAYLKTHAALEDVAETAAGADSNASATATAGEGATAVFSIVGHKADLLVIHLRETIAAVEAAERRLDRTTLARYLDQPTSYLSVTEASGYSERAREYMRGETDDDGIAAYVESRLYPELPEAEHVCFYPMDKRRDPEYNWYDLPFEERTELMAGHGEIGRQYAGSVTQMITGSVGFDDHEWGVTLFADDPTTIKRLLYEMRFDPSSSRYAEFGRFYFGRRFAPGDLGRLLAGETLPAYGTDEDGGGTVDGDGETDAADGDPDGDLTARIAALGVTIDVEDAHAVVVDSTAQPEELADAVDGLRGNFEHYDSHVRTTTVDRGGGESAVVSVWATERAADTAAGFLGDLPGVVERTTGPVRASADAPSAGGDHAGPPLGGDTDSRGGASGGGEAHGDHPHGTRSQGDDASAGTEAGGPDPAVRDELAAAGVYAGQPRDGDVHAMVLYSEADATTLAEAVDDLRDHFERYDSHVKTAVYAGEDTPTAGDVEALRGRAVVASLWETESAAETAADYLVDLPGVVDRAGDAGDAGDGFGTMGMFYTVLPEHRDAFLDRFEEVADLLEGIEGHRATALLADVDDENDMFIASRWDARENALEFFSSDDFRETVQWGREVLADRPRHVFLA